MPSFRRKAMPIQQVAVSLATFVPTIGSLDDHHYARRFVGVAGKRIVNRSRQLELRERDPHVPIARVRQLFARRDRQRAAIVALRLNAGHAAAPRPSVLANAITSRIHLFSNQSMTAITITFALNKPTTAPVTAL
jgi:hypothetical protein